jgi:hypothetical protein
VWPPGARPPSAGCCREERGERRKERGERREERGERRKERGERRKEKGERREERGERRKETEPSCDERGLRAIACSSFLAAGVASAWVMDYDAGQAK